MKPYYGDDLVTLYLGDAVAAAGELAAGSVRTVVTSPPYFGLRDYGEPEQIGTENTLGAYVTRLVDVFEALRPALADDGSVWLNLGDSYSGSGKGAVGSEVAAVELLAKSKQTYVPLRTGPAPASGLAGKNLMGVPWRVAFALQDAGWFLRSEIIWSKSNAMPENVRDRPSRSHEHLFMLTKSPRYFYDIDAVRVVYQGDRAASRRTSARKVDKPYAVKAAYVPDDENGRNLRTVWDVPTSAFPGAHFATYPPELVRPCVRAGSQVGDLVLDPFSGSGTTGAVATAEGRRYVGFDINRDYLDLSLRTRFLQPVLNWGAE